MQVDGAGLTSARQRPHPPELSPEEEAKRVAAVRRYEVLDTPPDGAFDRIAVLAADLFSVPIAIISLVDHDRIWFKSHHGVDAQQVGREPGLCASAILQTDPWILADAKRNLHALANPLVAGDFGLRFYAGVPLHTWDGHNLGTLCVIDRKPRKASRRQVARLKALASLVMDQMELRLAARKAVGELSQAVTEKNAALDRANLMAREIEHRVMNNLQLISGLLRVQSHSLGTSEASEQLMMAANRVGSIARVHQQIYKSESSGRTDCKVFLQLLCGELSGLLRPTGPAIVVEAEAGEVPTERLVHLGLIVNELVTNAAKHGAGRITVAWRHQEPDSYALSVSDEGAGLPESFDPQTAGGFGMKVISSSAQRLNGELVVGRGRSGGTEFTVVLPS